MSKNVLIVESPTKVKTIKKYLDKDFNVLASYGHIRDLLSKDGSVDPDNEFKMLWNIDTKSQKYVKAIADAVKDSENLYLATDPDREGEAISWHVMEILKEKKLLKNCKAKRIVFHEITKKAVSDALKNPRDINHDLISAYLARRALDYLFGFTLSPLLWRKLPGAKSAGRVQSVALRLIVEREDEITKFIKDEYWSVIVLFNQENKKFEAKLTLLDGEKLEKLSIKNEKQALETKQKIENQNFAITKIEKKEVKRQPYPPFITSTLQQEASKKLGFSASKTMYNAQSLYEGVKIGSETQGLITYMRTDSFHLASEAISEIRNFISNNYEKNFLPTNIRLFKKKVRNAQEAHEAIRPTNIELTPQKAKQYLNDEQYKLYKLIWDRTVACQMSDALFNRMTIDILSNDEKIGLRSTGLTCKFKGFLKLYEEGHEEFEKNEEEQKLPTVKEGAIDREDITLNQHFTQPPPRYTEASLVKKLEELGIGRPSTYASLIETLKIRKYVTLEKRQFTPDARGKIVIYFLKNFFEQYVEYDFTANLENKLDDISSGQVDWKTLLKEFWEPFITKVKDTANLKISNVIDMLEENMQEYLFGDETTEDYRKCPACDNGRINLKLSRYGAFLGCSNYQDCKYTTPIGKTPDQEIEKLSTEKNKLLGIDPDTNEEIFLNKGPYGFYLQWKIDDKKKNVAIHRTIDPSSIDLEKALLIKSLPKKLGSHEKQDIEVSIGRFGPYVKYQNKFYSIPKSKSLFEITLKEALQIIEAKDAKKK